MRFPSTTAISSSLTTHFELMEFGERTMIKTSQVARTETIRLHQESPPYKPPSESYQIASELPNALRKSFTSLRPKSSSLLLWLTKMESVGGEKCVDEEVKPCAGGGEPLCWTGGGFSCMCMGIGGATGCSWSTRGIDVVIAAMMRRPPIKIHEPIKAMIILPIRSKWMRKLARNPPMNAPTIPIMILPAMGYKLPRNTTLARKPATKPTNNQAITPAGSDTGTTTDIFPFSSISSRCR